MSNAISYATKFSPEIDKIITQKAVTGFFADGALKAQFVGANTVKIPKIATVGLGNYSRTGGYPKGATTLTHETLTLSMERGRQLFIDAQDVDESGVPGLVGQLVGEYTRNEVVPEVDAYVLSKLYSVASAQNHLTTYDSSKALTQLLGAINNVDDATGFNGVERIAFISSTLYGLIQTDPALSRQIIVSDFKQGDANFKFKSLNGCVLIPVASARMKSAYTFNAGASDSAGGFSPVEGAKDIHALVLPKDVCHLVKKVDKVDVLAPSDVEDFDAYKVNFRVYYDAFVLENKQNTIFGIATA